MTARTRLAKKVALGFSALLILVAPALSANAQDAKSLRPSYKAGYTYQFSQKQKMEMVMTIPGTGEVEQKVSTDMAMAAVATERRDGEAGVRVATTIKSIKFATASPAGANISYDSTNPVDENSALAVQFKPMLGKELVIIYDGDGKVVKFEGFKEFMDAAGAGAQMFSEEQFAQMADPTAMLGLDGDKSVGDKWSAAPVVEMGEMGTIKMPMELHYSKDEDTEAGHTCARIDTVGTAEMNMNIPGAPAGGGGGGVTTKESKVEGYYLIDPEAGMLRDSVVKMDLTMAINAGGQELTIPMKQEVNYKLLSMEKTK
jgi:hypothetical protein